MGYTHYWRNNVNGVDKVIDVGDAIKDCRKIIKKSEIPLKNGRCSTSCIEFNGVGEDAHETFMVDFNNPEKFSFCKTATKPYDLIVVAVLACLSEIHGFTVESDGNRKDWEDGVAFASKILGREVKNPIKK